MIQQGTGVVRIGPDNNFNACETERSNTLEDIQRAPTLCDGTIV
jgi:hypothetical protein